VHDTTRLVLEKVDQLGLAVAVSATSQFDLRSKPIDSLNSGILQAIERDLAMRYDRVVRRALFPEESRSDGFYLLAREILEGDFSQVSSALRRRIFLRAARSTALRNDVAEAQCLLDAGLMLEGPESDQPARARLMEAKGDVDAGCPCVAHKREP
jgi:hypothetical protein